jgi:hypothetical protein
MIPKMLPLAAAIVLFSACSHKHEPTAATHAEHDSSETASSKTGSLSLGSVVSISFPYGDETLDPFLVSDGARGFFLSWLDKSTSSMNLSQFDGGKWLPRRTVATGKMVINRADFPSMARSGRSLYAQWIEQRGRGTVVRIAHSVDSGFTWSAPVTPHPAMASEFGFVSMATGSDGLLNLAWLDGRGLPNGEEGSGDMQLHFVALPDAGASAPDTTLDARVCDCCQTDMAMTSNGPIVVYRDRSPAEIRDIAVVRRNGATWSSPTLVHDDGWHLAGCPVNGPQVAADDQRVVVVWFTAAGGEGRVQAVFSMDGGATFSKPVRVDDGYASGHVDVGLLSDGSAIVTWVVQQDSEASIKLKRVVSNGASGATIPIATGRSPAEIGYPRLTVSEDNVFVGWNGQKSVQLATVRISRS